MTTLTRPKLSGSQVHFAREAPRKAVSAFVIVVGLVVLGLTFANNLFKVGPSFETLMGDFRPHLTTTDIAANRADLAKLGAAGAELQTKLAPAMAQQLGMTPTEFNAFVAANYPQVAAGMTALPGIVTTFDGLVTTLDQQRPYFRSADAIPTKSLPATTMPWGLAVVGLVMVAAGAWIWVQPQIGAAFVTGFGLLLVVATVVMSLPGKAADADTLNSNLKPVYTAALVQQARESLTTVADMGTQLQDTMLPALATQLRMSPTQLQQFLGQNFPATAAALASLPTALPRFQNLVKTFDQNLDNYNTLKPVGFARIIWVVLVAGMLVALAGAGLLVWPRRRVVSL
jgi:hypothetical protein